ncbi:hypothetical protein BKH40_03815 [Helicobacter sp. 11S02629-2]|nr:hypothetical protein BKH40_03815 [Helicobacter sp. 11S02629-2]
MTTTLKDINALVSALQEQTALSQPASKNSIRMCARCRKRLPQSSLFRLQVSNKEIVFFSGIGRSFYICDECSKRADIKNILMKLANSSVVLRRHKNGKNK